MKYSYDLNKYLKLSLNEKLETYLSEKEAFKMSRDFSNDPIIDTYDFLKNHVIFDKDIPNFLFRHSAFKILKNVISELQSKGYKVKIYELYRSFKKQTREFDEISEMMKDKYPELNKSDLWEKITEFIADPSLSPPHCTGGAMDITLFKNGEEVDMGTKVNEITEKSNLMYENLSNEQKQNRKILYQVMIKHGFAPIASEWWHFSHGDMYWASFFNEKVKYDVIDL